VHINFFSLYFYIDYDFKISVDNSYSVPIFQNSG